MLDGEPILTERYAVGENLLASLVYSFRGLIMCEEPNPTIHMIRGAISINNSEFIEFD